MPIKSLQEKFEHELADIYDAEHQFLKGQQEMLAEATDDTLKEMLRTHIEQTKGHIKNLEGVFSAKGEEPKREMCAGAKGLVTEAKKMLEETQGAPKIRDCAIAGSAAKAEYYEISSYRDLIAGAEIMGQNEVVRLLQMNLEQEESTAMLIEQNVPDLLQKAMKQSDMKETKGAQASPTH